MKRCSEMILFFLFLWKTINVIIGGWFKNRKIPLFQLGAVSAGFLPVPDLRGHGSIMSALSGFSLSSALSCQCAFCKISPFQSCSAYAASIWPPECEFFHIQGQTANTYDSDLWRRGNRTGCRNITDCDQRKHTPQPLAEALLPYINVSLANVQFTASE